jgi:hypothetical protein
MAVAFDAATEDKVVSGGVTTLTYSHTCSGSDRFLYVALTQINHSGTPTATYGGVSMTPVYTRVQVYSSTWTHSGFFLMNPASGANNVVISSSGPTGTNSLRSGCVSYTGVDQTNPVLDDNSIYSASGGTMSISLTTASDGWAIISGANVDYAFSAGTNTDTLRASYGGLCDIADSGNDITAGTFNAQMTHAGTRGYGGIALAILPAGGGSYTGDIKSIAGVAQASIKSIAGVAIANIKSVAGVSNV